MTNNFITNNPDQKTLRTRLNTLIGISEELRFLVGYFYFSGWQEVYENLRNQPTLQLKLLVGLQVDNSLHTLVEYDHMEPGLSKDDQFNKFMTSMGKALNNNEMDSEEFYNQVILE